MRVVGACAIDVKVDRRWWLAGLLHVLSSPRNVIREPKLLSDGATSAAVAGDFAAVRGVLTRSETRSEKHVQISSRP